MQSREGQTILGAAVIDDVLGLVVLAVIAGAISASAGQGPPLSAGGVALIVLWAALFLGASAGAGHYLSRPLVRLLGRLGRPDLLLVVGLGVCFTLAFVAEAIGLAAIVGAFAAGFVIDPHGEGVRTREEEATLDELLRPIGAVFVPLFFVLMGVQVNLASLTAPAALGLGGALVVAAIAGKLACALGVLDRRIDRWTVAIGMVPRGEVGLIFAGIGTTLTLNGQPVLSESVFAAVVVMVLVTTLVAPPGLQVAAAARPRARGRANAGGAMTTPDILALDFDGVLCDGMAEYFETSRRTAARAWPGERVPGAEHLPAFRRLRPVIMTGWEMPLLLRAIGQGRPESDILEGWPMVRDEQIGTSPHGAALVEWLTRTLDEVRREWIAADRADWIARNAPYCELEALRGLVGEPERAVLVTTKEGEFARLILDVGACRWRRSRARKRERTSATTCGR